MNLGIYSYLLTTLIFTGVIVILEPILLRKTLSKYRILISIMILISVIGTVIEEPPALATQAWTYNLQDMLNMHIFGAEIETFVYSSLVMFCITGATLFFADAEDGHVSFRKLILLRIKEATRRW